MPIIAVAATRGAECTRIAEMLALFSGVVAQNTIYIEVLRERESSLFLLPPDTDKSMLTRIQIICVDPVQASQEITAAIRDQKNDGATVIIGLPVFAQHLTDDLLKAINILLIPATPAHPSMADALRLLSAVQGRVAAQRINVHPWIVGAGCAGGSAISDRLRAAAAVLLARDAQAVLKPENLPILHWGMPLLHWSSWDKLSSLDVTDDKEPPMHVRRACNTLYHQVILLARHPERAPTFDELAQDSVVFFEPWLLNDTRSQAQKYLDLGEDLSLIEAGLGPIPADLSNTAAHLYGWGVTRRTFTALEGTVSDHPEQPTGDWVKTSEVMAFGPEKTWARTVSRYYVLVSPLEDVEPSPETR